jgi:hypothetical protein
MSLRRDQRGFILSLDATLAVLVSLIVLAGAAHVGSPGLTYEQHGYLRLERYANDALRVLTLTGAVDNAIQAVNHLDYEEAEQILRENLRKILPEEIQFKLSVGELLTVYPSDSGDWEGVFENVKDRTASSQLSPMPPKENYLRVLAWIPDSEENWFMDQIHEVRPEWAVTKITSDDPDSEENFREEIQQNDYDAVFIPDAERDFANVTVNALDTFTFNGGRLVVGGDTLFNNTDFIIRRWTFGITNNLDRRADDTWYGPWWDRYFIEDMYLWHPEHDFDHLIVRPFVVSYKVDYDGDWIYYYGDTSPVGDGYDESTATVLSSWGDAPESDRLHWNGIIVNNRGTGTAVFFNMNFVQSAEGGAGTSDWVELAARAIGGGYYLRYQPMRLHVWRGEGV